MHIALSNICWEKGTDKFPFFLDSLVRNNIYYVELALSCIWEEPAEISSREIQWLKRELSTRGITLVSLHSLTYTRPDLSLFETRTSHHKLVEYIRQYVSIAKQLKCPNLVFGSPKARVIPDSLEKKHADAIFLSFLHKIDPLMDGVNFNIEPLSLNFTDYLNSFGDCVSILSKNLFSNIFVQLDLRTFIETCELLVQVKSNFQYVRHVHVSNPGLSIPGKPYSKIHKQLCSLLKSMNYNGSITAEVIHNPLFTYSEFVKEVTSKMNYFYG